MEKARIDHLELLTESHDERIQDLDERVSAMEPAVQQTSNRNVVVYISVAITVINLILLLLNSL